MTEPGGLIHATFRRDFSTPNSAPIPSFQMRCVSTMGLRCRGGKEKEKKASSTIVTSALTIRVGEDCILDFSYALQSEFQCLLPSQSLLLCNVHPLFSSPILSFPSPAVSTIDKRFLTTETKSYALPSQLRSFFPSPKGRRKGGQTV